MLQLFRFKYFCWLNFYLFCCVLTESDASLVVEATLKKMKVAELKELCKEKQLSTSGKKADLIARLCEHDKNLLSNANVSTTTNGNTSVTDDLDGMSLEDLQDAAIARGIMHTGTREEVLERIRQDIQMTKDMQEHEQPIGRDSCIALSYLLEMRARNEAAKEPTIPKFITLKITSLGLEPEKYTVGGAPSVTADVIRKLAGDPFADPPKFGTVRATCSNAADIGTICNITNLVTTKFIIRHMNDWAKKVVKHCLVYALLDQLIP
jgi:SAP domain